MNKRLRIGSVVIQPILVWDDGTELFPGPPIQESRIPLSEARQALDDLPRLVAELEQSLEQKEGDHDRA